ncbi:hypothetical protein TRM7557_02018 [Tritonibacter multivorans]|uniref:Mycofactocin system glycosyltransferase n=1 Tax=Tritonibacter multivorans TaxID=928856 RepID=A0A0P1GBF7_9RHOB|nr:glycosyltransferase [Tritonibacter multivorans]MDA7421983.1 glycosyltransferase [Tritonibacter multivorans]CUH78731.1 hypothetical protein TRM7557_02018 [Tritonibacter multivorans]SFD68151.1 hypothetical protein SAMN04488049_12112 [Tritonibacter multivorans]
MTSVALIICSVGRPDCLRDLLPWIARQTCAPDRVLFVVTKPEDLPPEDTLLEHLPDAEILYSPKGLPRQRNCGLEAVLDTTDIVVFIDDDYLPAGHALAGIVSAFESFPQANGITGLLLADGIHSQGLSVPEAAALLAEHEKATQQEQADFEVLEHNLVGLYGCNMAYRTRAIGTLRFDESLPLYGWQEDVDFAARLPGEKLRTNAFSGVHCGTKAGRETSGHMLGYSQVVNPIYLSRKGSLPWRFSARLVLRNVLANHVKMWRPEPWIDRAQRARGNWIAVRDILLGRATPMRILEMAKQG